jgi:hypothetical protein
MANPLDDLKGKTISVNGVPMPDRKRLRISSYLATVADNSAGSTDLTISTPSGGSWERPPSPGLGDCYFDTDLGVPIWWSGTAWVDAGGVSTAITFDLLDADYYWIADYGVTTEDGAVTIWDDRIANVETFNTTGTPTHDSTNANWNGLPAVDFDVTLEDHLLVNPADWSYANQEFFHDGTTDWEIQLPFRPTTLVGTVLGTQGEYDDSVGFALRVDSAGRVLVTIGNGTDTRTAQTTVGLVTAGSKCVIGARYTSSTSTLEVSFNGSFDYGAGVLVNFTPSTSSGYTLNIMAAGDDKLIGDGSLPEVMMLKRKLTANERINLINYWTETYDI